MNPPENPRDIEKSQQADAAVEVFTDPGIPAHKNRMADTDPKAAKNAERQVVFLFVLSILGTIGTIVAYFALPLTSDPSSVRIANLLLGVALAVSLLGIGFAAVHWAKTLMSDHEVSEERHVQSGDAETRQAALDALSDGAKDSGIGRRGVLKGAVVSALAIFPLTIAVPLIGSVGGDWNVGKLKHTFWSKNRRMVRDHDPEGTPVKPSDLTIGSVFHVIPEGVLQTENPMEEKAKSVVLLVRLDERELKEEEARKGWSYDGIVAYSKICTHVGCPVALYERQTHHLLCPCHQSTFDVSDGAKVVFGPAKRPLPQLPITVDADGYLVAQDDFNEPIGPSFWERLK